MMNQFATSEATLEADGITVHLKDKVPLPPGRVTVTLQPASPIAGPTMLDILDRIHRQQADRGKISMTDEEMAAEIADIRAEDE